MRGGFRNVTASAQLKRPRSSQLNDRKEIDSGLETLTVGICEYDKTHRTVENEHGAQCFGLSPH